MTQLFNEKIFENLDEKKIKFQTNKPFCHIVFSNFFEKNFAEKLRKEVLKQNFFLTENDLYKFFRTCDFKNLNNENLNLKKLENIFFSKKFLEFLKKITDKSISKKKITLHALKLLNTNYLLPHNDKVEKRKLAFVLNLTKNWEEKKGGELVLFSCYKKSPKKIIKKIPPKFNTFTLFEVCEDSFHEILEVEKNLKRVSISGWFF